MELIYKIACIVPIIILAFFVWVVFMALAGGFFGTLFFILTVCFTIILVHDD
jgi:hypothetical protein